MKAARNILRGGLRRPKRSVKIVVSEPDVEAGTIPAPGNPKSPLTGAEFPIAHGDNYHDSASGRLGAVAGTPCLNLALRDTRTEQEARYARLLSRTNSMKALGQKTITIAITDLEALISIAAATDAGVRA